MTDRSTITGSGQYHDPYILTDPLSVTGLDIFDLLRPALQPDQRKTWFRFTVPPAHGGTWTLSTAGARDTANWHMQVNDKMVPHRGLNESFILTLDANDVVGVFMHHRGLSQGENQSGMTLTLWPPHRQPIVTVPTGLRGTGWYRHPSGYRGLVFRWNAVPGVTAYEVRFAETIADLEQAPVSRPRARATRTSFYTPNLGRGVRRYFQVRSVGPGDTSAWSDPHRVHNKSNREPRVWPVEVRVGEDEEPVTGQIRARDSDQDDHLTFALETAPKDSLGHPVSGLTINSDGAWSFDPGSRFQHLTDGEQETITFTYRVSDNHGGHTTDTGTIIVIGAAEPADEALTVHWLMTFPDHNPVYRFWSGEGDLSLDGHTWAGRSWVSLSAAENALDGPDKRMTVSLAVSTTSDEPAEREAMRHLRTILMQDPGPLEVVIEWIFSRDHGQTWQRLPATFAGRLSNPVIRDGVYSIEIETWAGDVDRGRPLKWSDEDQRARAPGDRGLEYMRQLSEGIVDARWPP